MSPIELMMRFTTLCASYILLKFTLNVIHIKDTNNCTTKASLVSCSVNLYKRLIGVSTVGYLSSRFISILVNPFSFR